MTLVTPSSGAVNWSTVQLLQNPDFTRPLKGVLSANAWFRQLLTLLQKFSYEIVVRCALGLPLFFKLAWVASTEQYS
jgi:hypothetical protein